MINPPKKPMNPEIVNQKSLEIAQSLNGQPLKIARLILEVVATRIAESAIVGTTPAPLAETKATRDLLGAPGENINMPPGESIIHPSEQTDFHQTDFQQIKYVDIDDAIAQIKAIIQKHEQETPSGTVLHKIAYFASMTFLL